MNIYYLQKFVVKEHEVHAALLSGDPHDQLAIAYHLIIDNKRIADEAAKAELKDFYVASSPPPVSFSPNDLNQSPIRPHPERIARKSVEQIELSYICIFYTALILFNVSQLH